MIEFTLTGEQRAIRDTVRDFVKREVVPYEQILIQREIEGAAGASPGLNPVERAELQSKARASGLWAIDTPQEFGGADLDPVTQALIHEELGKTFVDFEFGGSAIPTLYVCADQQRERYLLPVLAGDRPPPAIGISEPFGGSDVHSMRTTAVRDGDYWVITGEKTWITHANTADFCIVYARTPREGNGGITSFLVDRDMGWTSQPIPLMGSRDKVGSIVFDNVKVPNENILGQVNRGFDHLMGFIYRNRGYVLSAKSLGAATRLLEMAIEWCQGRRIKDIPLADRDSVQFRLAKCEIELRAAKLLVYQAAATAHRGADYRHEACAAKYYVANTANRVVDEVLQLHGAIGYAKESAVERWYRDLRVERIYDGTDEVNLSAIARNLLQRHRTPGEVFAS